jgi:hypothetical protein
MKQSNDLTCVQRVYATKPFVEGYPLQLLVECRNSSNLFGGNSSREPGADVVTDGKACQHQKRF